MSAQPAQVEAVVDLDAIAANVAVLASGSTADLMAVVKADGYGHGLLPAARAALAGGATWLGVCTADEALALRSAGVTAPVLAWLLVPGTRYDRLIAADVEVSAASIGQLDEAVAGAHAAGRPARVHLKVDTGLGRNGAQPADWPDLVTAAAKAAGEGTVVVTGVWSHFAYADEPGHPTIATQMRVFDEAVEVARGAGVDPPLRHLANSAATLTLPAAHHTLVRPGIAVYGLSPMPRSEGTYGLRPAMTLHGPVALAKRVPAGHGVSYGHEYHTDGPTTLVLVPLGYADGVPRHASGVGPIQVGGRTYRIAGRVCMDQVVLDVGDAAVRPGDVATLFGSGDGGEPTASDWAEVVGTINYEIVTRVGNARVPRVYVGTAGVER